MTISVLAPTWRLEFLPRPLSFPCLRQLSPSPSSPILSPPPNTTLSGGGLEVPQTRPSLSFQVVSMLAIQLLELVWNTKGAMKVNGRMPYPASVNSGSPPPDSSPRNDSSSSSRRESRTLLEGWRSDAPSGVVIRLPGTSLPRPCSFVPLITASSTRNATLPAARPSLTPTERQNR